MMRSIDQLATTTPRMRVLSRNHLSEKLTILISTLLVAVKSRKMSLGRLAAIRNRIVSGHKISLESVRTKLSHQMTMADVDATALLKEFLKTARTVLDIFMGLYKIL